MNGRVVEIPVIDLAPARLDDLLERIEDAAVRGTGVRQIKKEVRAMRDRAECLPASLPHVQLAVQLGFVIEALAGGEFASARYLLIRAAAEFSSGGDGIRRLSTWRARRSG